MASRVDPADPKECWGVWLWKQGFGIRAHFADGTERAMWDFKHIIPRQVRLVPPALLFTLARRCPELHCRLCVLIMSNDVIRRASRTPAPHLKPAVEASLAQTVES
jgi:hypothetical protein